MNPAPAFFGYGSLVNLATHGYADPRPARLAGWRRVWRRAPIRPVAFLSVEPCPDTVIDGVIARVPGADWAALDAREGAYTRRDVTGAITHDGPPGPVAVYVLNQGSEAPSADHPVLLSYIDVVAQGFHTLAGESGVRHFFETTHGWSRHILNDRPAPRYPRAMPVAGAVRALVDEWVAGL